MCRPVVLHQGDGDELCMILGSKIKIPEPLSVVEYWVLQCFS